MRSEPVDNCGCRLERTGKGLHMVDCSLHSAAPDLLAACKMLVKSLTILQNSSILLKNVELNSVKAADAAIKKAEGK